MVKVKQFKKPVTSRTLFHESMLPIVPTNNKDRTQRIAETAPKALRQQMREMAAEAG